METDIRDAENGKDTQRHFLLPDSLFFFRKSHTRISLEDNAIFKNPYLLELFIELSQISLFSLITTGEWCFTNTYYIFLLRPSI